MKKYAIAFFALFIIAKLTADPQEVFGRSFMFTRPGDYHFTMRDHLWHDIIYNKKGETLGGFQLTTFYQRSITQEKAARYFLINGKNELLVSGDGNKNDSDIRDIRAEWLNLGPQKDNVFRGTLSMSPHQQQFGFAIEYNQDLKKWFDIKFIRDWYLSIIVPFMVVDNDLRLTQANVINKPTQSPQDIIEAFQQRDWKFHRIEGERSRFGAGEIKIILGSSYMSENHFQIGYYSALTIPAGKKQNPKFFFDPVVGNNQHPGLSGAVSFQILLNRNPDRFALCFFLNLESTLLIRNKQFRTFDLKGKPWSRFMLFNKKGAPPNQNIPGVNLLTREVVVNPFNMVDFSMGWRLKNEKVEFELGYNIWGHGDERVRLRNPIKEIFGIAGTAANKTASGSTISNRPLPDDPEFIRITKDDFDANSAQSGSALNHKAHMAVGIKHIGKNIDSFIGAGWFVDLPQKNSPLKLWGVWVKLGATF